MNRKLSLWLIVGVIGFIFSCKKDPENTAIIDKKPITEVNYSFSDKNLNDGVRSVSEVLSMTTNKTLDVSLQEPVEIDPTRKDGIKRILNIDKIPEKIISDIHFWSDYVFVSYISHGGKAYGSTLDVYSIKNVPGITRIGRFTFENINIQAVEYMEGRLFLACMSDSLKGFVETIIYNPKLSFQPTVEDYINIPATDITDIATFDNDLYKQIYVLANNVKEDGTTQTGVYIFQNKEAMDIDQVKFVAVDRPVSLKAATNSSDVYVLQNTSPTSITKITSSGGVESVPLALDGQAANIGFEVNNQIYVRAGNEMQICKNDISPKQQAITWNESGNANQISNFKNVAIIQDWLLMIGNEGSGIRLCGLRNRTEAEITAINDLTSEQSLSSLSLLAANDNIVFIADQNGGLQVLWRISVGMPKAPMYEQNLGNLPKIINSIFPASRNNYAPHLNLFEDKIPLNIHVTTETKVYISIVKLGASYPSSLGYYLYDAVPGDASGLNCIPIFPNTLSVYDVGNTVALCDADGKPVTFKAGQNIGFYFISGGWDAKANNGYGGINTKIDLMYSLPQFNTKSDLKESQQHVLYRIRDYNAHILMGFEDIWINSQNVGGREIDFDDLIIAVSDNMDSKDVTKVTFEGIPYAN